MKERIEAAVFYKGVTAAYGAIAVRIAKQLAKEHGWIWVDCSGPKSGPQGILRRN